MQVTLIGNSFHSHGYGKNYSWRKPAHAQTNHQDNSTSGRGARASYQNFFRYFLHVVRSGVDYCRAYLTIAHEL